MLDGFHQLHRQLVFRDQKHLRLSETALKTARRAAANSLDPPERAFLKDNDSFRQHRIFYEFHLAREMAARTYRKLSSQIDRTLVEVVILLGFLRIEEVSESRNSFSVSRSVAVLGWMIQERLQYIILQTGSRSFQELMEFRRTYGINNDVWEKRLVGAAAEANALMQISRVGNLHLFQSTLVDDVLMGIDFFIETSDGNGACVSVKTDVDGQTRFLLESELGYEQAWNRIEAGSKDFREYAHRDWRPILVLVGKVRGEAIDLEIRGSVNPWVDALGGILNKTQPTNLVLTA